MDLSKYLDVLDIPSFKDKQLELIKCFTEKNDSIGVLPTGYGKSLCYILPHLIKNINVIIISPLLSLMEDQYNKLVKKGINCRRPRLSRETPAEVLL